MATNTTNYGWTKPDYEDDADIAVLNETFDAIDEDLKTIENGLYTNAMAKSAVYGLGISIASNADLNSYTTPGVYNCTPSVAASLSHCPTNQSLRLEVKNFASASSYVQTIITPENTTSGEVVVYRRLMLSGAWKPWYKFTGTEVT